MEDKKETLCFFEGFLIFLHNPTTLPHHSIATTSSSSSSTFLVLLPLHHRHHFPAMILALATRLPLSRPPETSSHSSSSYDSSSSRNTPRLTLVLLSLLTFRAREHFKLTRPVQIMRWISFCCFASLFRF